MEKVDIKIYRMFNLDLFNFSDKDLLEHYNKYGKNEKRVYNKKSFYDIYKQFDVKYYKKYNEDLRGMNELQLMKHYHLHGKNENRRINKNKIISVFKNDKSVIIKNIYPELDLEYYRRYNMDLENLNDRDLILHYGNFGIVENRIINFASLMKIRYPDLDINFYGNVNIDLIGFSDRQLLDHYVNYGFDEGKIINLQMFLSRYPEFDVNYYRDFNVEMNGKSDIELMCHYNCIGFWSNEKYLGFDYDASNLPEEEVNFCSYHSRRISSYEELVSIYNSLGKRFYICNEKSFYQVCDDFDLNYYKERYNVFGSNYEVYKHYVTIGFPNRYVCNPTIKIIFYISCYTEKIGGLMVLHNIIKEINENGCGIKAKIFNLKNLKYRNNFCNNFAKIDEVNENTIVVYPEIIKGNPLNAGKVVRWILLDLGIEMPINHFFNFGKNDLIYFWGNQEGNNIYFKKLTKHWFNPIFSRYNYGERVGSCYMVKKGKLFHKSINYFHNEDSLEMDGFGSDLITINNIFNKCQYFYCYDPNSAYCFFARLCGCIPILYPQDGISKNEFFSRSPFFCIESSSSGFFAYGNSLDEIENAINYKKEDFDDLLIRSRDFENGLLNSFLKDVENWDNNINTITNYFSEKYKEYPSIMINYDLDLGYYRKYNFDLSEFSDLELFNHFYASGKDEGRVINEKTLREKISNINFDLNYYRHFNIDLSRMSDNELLTHFMDCGINENRIYNLNIFLSLYNDFNVGFYRKYNKDLKKFSDFELMAHFHNYGRYEKRKFKN